MSKTPSKSAPIMVTDISVNITITKSLEPWVESKPTHPPRVLTDIETIIAILLNSPEETLRTIRHENTRLIEKGGKEMNFRQVLDTVGVENIKTGLPLFCLRPKPSRLKELISFMVNITDAQLECLDAIKTVDWQGPHPFSNIVALFYKSYSVIIHPSIAYVLLKVATAKARVNNLGVLDEICALIYAYEVKLL